MTEASFQPDWFSCPGDTIALLMEQYSVSGDELADGLNCDRDTIRGLLTGAIRIDDQIAENLSAILGGTRGYWRNRHENYEKTLARLFDHNLEDSNLEWARKIPKKDFLGSGDLFQTRKQSDQIKSRLAFFGVSNPDEWRRQYTDLLDKVVFRTSPSFESQLAPLSIWLRRGEIEATLAKCEKWDRDQLRARLDELRNQVKSKSLPQYISNIRRVCAECGVALVFVKAPTGCRASGATRILSSDKAMILLSFRYLSDDHFWFTFFHEIGHLLLHGDSSTFVDGDEIDNSDKEKEANAFSASILIPIDCQEKLFDIKLRTKEIVRFAVSVGVSPGVVVGQLQHLKLIGPQQFNFLKRRYSWDEVSEAFG